MFSSFEFWKSNFCSAFLFFICGTPVARVERIVYFQWLVMNYYLLKKKERKRERCPYVLAVMCFPVGSYLIQSGYLGLFSRFGLYNSILCHKESQVLLMSPNRRN